MNYLEKTKKIGNEWIKGNHHRVYFSEKNVQKMIGLEVDYYKTNRIKSATLKNESISNSKADKMMGNVTFYKHYYNAKTNEFESPFCEEIKNYFDNI